MSSGVQTWVEFTTVRGTAAAVFAGDRLVRLALAEVGDPTAAQRAVERAHPEAQAGRPTAAQKRTLAAIVKYLDGSSRSLPDDVPLHLEGLPPFFARVYEALRRVPPGKVVTYGELAELAGNAGAARAVGTAMQKNPLPLVVPCHRVVRGGGDLGEYSAPGGVGLKRRLLEHEGALSPPSIDEALATLRARDRKLAAVIKRAPRYDLIGSTDFDLFEALSRTIVYQQLSGKAAATIYGRVEALLGKAPSKRAAVLQKLPDSALRGAGLSTQKTLAMRDLAAKHLAGALPSTKELAHLDDEAIVAKLTAVRGIGRWSAEMLMMFRLGRLDVMPSTDLGVQKGHALVYRKDGDVLPPKELHAFGERWRPYRSVAAWYLWRAVELDAQ